MMSPKDNFIEVSCHLVVSARRIWSIGRDQFRGEAGAVRVAKAKPSLRPDEVAIRLNVELPIALFRQPDLVATITVPEERAPFTISPEVRENIAEHIRLQTGFNVRIEAAPPEA
jgi:hypothetical protein